jgi:hypothetical protein
VFLALGRKSTSSKLKIDECEKTRSNINGKRCQQETLHMERLAMCAVVDHKQAT